jgi:hypothetical protein
VDHLHLVINLHHLPSQYRENLRESERANLHVAKGKLFARNLACEIVHQIFFPRGKAFDNSSLLPLERFAFEDLRNAPPK